MSHLKIWIAAIVLFVTNFAYATTWDEPWMDNVIKQSDCFVLAVVKHEPKQNKNSVKLTILKTLAGERLQSEVELSDFYLLKLCSMSAGEGPEFHFKNLDSCYFFLKKNEKGDYSIATPTTGFAITMAGKVKATYRHSYHMALVAAEVYENTMTAIFNNYHNLAFDQNYISKYVQNQLALKPAGMSAGELDTFFAQHVALECIYHLQLKGFDEMVLPFLNTKGNFHAVISAARALSVNNTPVNQKSLYQLIADTGNNDFTKVIAIWALARYKPVALKADLTKLSKTASTEENGFGGNIMDPRVCTTFPTVKDALDQLLKTI